MEGLLSTKKLTLRASLSLCELGSPKLWLERAFYVHGGESANSQRFSRAWTVDDSSSLYMIDRWGGGYFAVAPSGELTVSPLQERGVPIPIIDVLREARVGRKMPRLERFLRKMGIGTLPPQDTMTAE